MKLFLSTCGCILLLALSGCVSDQTRADIHDSAQASYNAAYTLPPSPQATVIMANQVAIGAAVSLPIIAVDSANPVTPPSPAPKVAP